MKKNPQAFCLFSLSKDKVFTNGQIVLYYIEDISCIFGNK